MTDDKRNSSTKAGELDRRSVLVGAAATTVTVSRPGVTNAQPGGVIHADSAVYMDPKYLATFNNSRYSKANVAAVRQVIYDHFKSVGKKREELQWGLYQKWIEPTAANWGTQAAFDNWEVFVQEAREDLQKQPAPSSSDPKLAMNPSNTALVAPNLLEHLDEVIRIALWDYQDVALFIAVDSKKRRHHRLSTGWALNGNKPDTLIISIGCPDGGWQGYAVWPFKAPTAHITKLTASWQVPAAPKNSTGDQILFIFNGIESSSTKTVPGGILQPVLQWTKAGWAVRSWYVRADFDPVQSPDVPDWSAFKSQDDIDKKDKGRCYTPAVPVNPGQTIMGTITGGIDSNGKYNYISSVAVDGVLKNDTVLSVKDIPELSYPVCAVESYGVRHDIQNNTDDDYPTGSITMTAVALQVDGGSVNNIQWKESQRKGADYDPHSRMQGKVIEFKRT